MSDAEPSVDPVEQFVSVATRTVPAWLEACVVRTAEQVLGRCPDDLAERARAMAGDVAPGLLTQLEQLVRTDVDEQRTNPLSVLRAAARHPTEVLRAAGVPPVRRDAFAEERFPDDVYDLGPASWSDVHDDLHDAGILWGAWKAATVLQRRRAEGRR